MKFNNNVSLLIGDCSYPASSKTLLLEIEGEKNCVYFDASNTTNGIYTAYYENASLDALSSKL